MTTDLGYFAGLLVVGGVAFFAGQVAQNISGRHDGAVGVAVGVGAATAGAGLGLLALQKAIK